MELDKLADIGINEKQGKQSQTKPKKTVKINNGTDPLMTMKNEAKNQSQNNSNNNTFSSIFGVPQKDKKTEKMPILPQKEETPQNKAQNTDLYADFIKLKRKCDLLPTEQIKETFKASYKEPNTDYMGAMVMTNFRLIFKFEDDYFETKYYFSEDYFKIPYPNILKIDKTSQDKKLSFQAYPVEISLKDTRTLVFHIWEKGAQTFLYKLNEMINQKDRIKIFEFTKLYGKEMLKNYSNGWDIYNAMKEYDRQGITKDNTLNLRFSMVNVDYTLCATYPHVLVTHNDMTDEELKEASLYRTKNRLPVLSYYYKGNRDVPNPTQSSLSSTPSIWRCSQNKGGLTGNKRNESDEKLLKCCVSLCAKLFILDARPYINALANRVNGGGFENMKNYNNVELNFCGIDNIHVAKGSLNKIYQLSLRPDIMNFKKFWSSLQSTGWYQFVYLILHYSCFISETLQNNYSVLIHCSDGWDRTAQLITLSQILLDPYFRTIEGFAVLIEKDWLSFGHQFGLRNGISYKDGQGEDQRAPIFLQWLDCVHQLLHQFPNAFEFNVELLLFLAKNYSSNLYGTFMYNSEKERNEYCAKTSSTSVWTDVMRNVSKYKNVYYNNENPVKILSPNYAPYNLVFWREFFMENNNDYQKNIKFFSSEFESSLQLTSISSFFEHEKKNDILKIMNLEVKQEENAKILYDLYLKIKDKPLIMNKLSDKCKKVMLDIEKDVISNSQGNDINKEQNNNDKNDNQNNENKTNDSNTNNTTDSNNQTNDNKTEGNEQNNDNKINEGINQNSIPLE